MPAPVVDEIDRLYSQFAVYTCPRGVWVCPQCGPEWSSADICSAPLRSLSLRQLGAVHVMTLDDDGLRYFFPRLIDLLLSEPSPWFDFRLADLKGRLAKWHPAEASAVRDFADVAWRELLHTYPAALGYFSDVPTVIDFLACTDISMATFLDHWDKLDGLAPAQHLADLVDHAFATAAPVEPEVMSWLRRPVIGERLQAAFFAAESEEAAARLSTAYELWTVCRSA